MRIIPTLTALLLSTSAMALQAPEQGKEDPRMQTAIYSPGQIYYLHLMVGHTLAITLPSDELHNEKYGSDAAHIHADIPANTNLVFLKAIAITPPKSLFIHATLADGSSRLYPFQVDVVPATGESDDPYTLTFKDPAAAAAARVAAGRAWRQRQDEKAAHAALVAAASAPVDTNFRYVLQGKTTGDWNLLPTREVGDDGRSTHFHFPGQSAPNVYTVSADGKETTPDCTPNSVTQVTTCHLLAKQWRLRDGDSALCIFNDDHKTVADPAPTNTSSPDFERTLKAQP